MNNGLITGLKFSDSSTSSDWQFHSSTLCTGPFQNILRRDKMICLGSPPSFCLLFIFRIWWPVYGYSWERCNLVKLMIRPLKNFLVQLMNLDCRLYLLPATLTYRNASFRGYIKMDFGQSLFILSTFLPSIGFSKSLQLLDMVITMVPHQKNTFSRSV